MANDYWRTPPEVFNYFDQTYSFNVDVAASDENHLCQIYYTEKRSGLIAVWGDVLLSGAYAWCNPPYSNPLPWVDKCIWESQYSGIGSVLLLNCDMSTKWARRLLEIKCEVVFITGARIGFLDNDGKPIKGNNRAQVAFHIPPFVREGEPTTSYVKLSTIME